MSCVSSHQGLTGPKGMKGEPLNDGSLAGPPVSFLESGEAQMIMDWAASMSKPISV